MLLVSSCLGLSVNFGVPISGVLFGVELCGSFYRTKIYTKSIFASTLGSFVTRWLLSAFAGKDTLVMWINVSIPAPAWRYQELPFYVALGVICGFLGCLFVYWNEQMMKLKKAYGGIKILNIELKYLWCLLIVSCVATASYPGFIGQFMSLGSVKAFEDLSLPDLSPSNPKVTAKDWLSNGIFVNLILFVVLRYCLTTLMVTCPIPGGPYTPFLVVGAGLGRLYGETIVHMFPDWGSEIKAYTYPVVAAAALTAGSTHQRFSSALIVLELAGVTMMFPIMIAVWVASAVAERVYIPLADSIIKMRGWTSYSELQSTFQDVPICELMEKNPECFITEKCTKEDIAHLLKKYPDRIEYPVCDSAVKRRLLGVVDKTYLQSLLDTETSNASTTIEINHAPVESPLTTLPDSLEPGKITLTEINPVPLALHQYIPMTDLHACVVLTRITTVYVVEKGKFVGIVPVSLLKQFCVN
eukprot:TRINITY_DN6116_c0_g1_i2.p1 TRINITY_DN6116_c0_g1~~TRINITY_DN6116_c0_g1_i2.p1  ORF type:complete len:470 (-),score=74.57 TRINITY_DN6116_c0_g1_i2:90-1499(-)